MLANNPIDTCLKPEHHFVFFKPLNTCEYLICQTYNRLRN